jgi:hypothetical protein
MNTTETHRWLLVVNPSEGEPWTLTLSREVIRFVGQYARLPGIGDADGMLRFVPMMDR